MPFKQKLAQLTGVDSNLLPSSYQIIGDVLLLKFMKIKKLSQKKSIAKAILDLLPYVKTVCEIRGIEGELRNPKVKKLEGKGTETVHKEHGILYKLDASKIMFSKGNLFERQRLVKKVKPRETVIDMFAGIGYFSLAVAKNAKKVIAIEKNPLAFRYLKENIRLNRIKNVEPILGDNRKILLSDTADRIIMGYFPNTKKFLPSAISMLKSKGVIHFHNTYKKNELWNKPISQLEKISGITYRILTKKKVKSVAPNTYHVVLDVTVRK